MKKLKILNLFCCSLIGWAGCMNAAESEKSKVIRVMSYNIHHGEGLDKRVDLERIAELIKAAKADIVALQEVDRGVERTAKRDLPAELSRLTGLKYAFEKNINYQGGEYGNAILTRFPIVQQTNTHYKMLRPDEQRGALQVVLNIDGKELAFVNTHIDHRADDSERVMNVDEMKQIVARYHPRPVIICGDFNDNPGSRTHKKMKEFLRDAWELVGAGDGFTFSADKPNKRIDYIWVSENLTPLKIQVLSSRASDHLPLVAEIKLPQ